MKKTLEKNLKSTKGITLIALIITIIVLLILAGVTISLTLGNNGIFKTATNAVEEHIIAQQKEELERAILNIKMNKIAQGKTIQISDLNELNNDTFQVEDTGAFPVIVTTSKYEFQIDDDYKVTYIGPANGLRVTYTLSTKEWTEDDVIITLNATSEKGTIEEINTPTGLTKNADGTYTARENGTYKFIVKDNLNNQKEIEVKINNIDRNVSVSATEIDGDKFTLNITTNYEDEMVEKYIYYVNGKEPIESTSKTQIVDDLTEKTLYKVYVELYSTSGNKVTSKPMDVETTEMKPKKLIPPLTSNTSAGGNAFATSCANGTQPWYAFDGNIPPTATGGAAGYFVTNSSTNQLGYDFGEGNLKTVKKVVYYGNAYDANCRFTKFVLQYSDNGTNWIDVETFITEAISNYVQVEDLAQEFVVTSSVARHRYWRINGENERTWLVWVTGA